MIILGMVWVLIILNFVRNTISKIIDFLLKTYIRCDYMEEDELNTIADKLRK